MLDRCGVEMQTQAQFTYEISKHVIGSYDFMFSSLQPEVKIRNDEAWKRAYVLAFKYLQKYEMKTTLATVEKEFAGQEIPTNAKFMRREKVDDYLSKILKENRPVSFRRRVAKFAHIKAKDEDEAVTPQSKKSSKVLTPTGNRLKEMAATMQGRQQKQSQGKNEVTPRKGQKW